MLKENRYEEPSQLRRGIKLHYQGMVSQLGTQNRSPNTIQYKPYILNKTDITRFAEKTERTPVKQQKNKLLSEGPVYQSYIEKIMKHNDEKLKKINEQHSQEKSSFRQKIGSLQKQNENLKTKIYELTMQKQKSSKIVKKLQQYESQIKQLTNEYQKSEEVVLNPERESLKEIAELKRYRRQLKEENGNLHSTIVDLSGQLQRLKAQFQQYKISNINMSINFTSRMSECQKPIITQSTIIDMKQSQKDRKYIHHLEKQLYEQGCVIGQRNFTIQDLNQKIVETQMEKLNNKYRWMFQ